MFNNVKLKNSQRELRTKKEVQVEKNFIYLRKKKKLDVDKMP